MPWSQGINFRGTSGYVVDPAGDTYEIGTTANYPRTTPQGNTVGWEEAPTAAADRNASEVPECAGVAYVTGPVTADYRIDLPAPGNYTIQLAAGDASVPPRIKVELFDGSTSLGILAEYDSGTEPSETFLDAANNAWFTGATWLSKNVSVTKSFASTICRFRVGGTPSGTNGKIAHVFVEQQGSGPPASGGAPGLPILGTG